MSEEWGTPISKGKIIDRRNRLIEYRNTREIRTIPLSRVIDENILDINYMIYEIERLNNIINELEKYIGNEYYCFDNESLEFKIAKDILDKLQELKGSNK